MLSRTIRATLFLSLLLAPALVSAQQKLTSDAATDKNTFLSDSLNAELPSWLSFSGEYRIRVEGFTGGDFAPDKTDAYLLSRLRINMRVEAASWLRLMVQGQDAHVLGKNQQPPAPPYQNTFDLRSGFIELGKAEQKHFILRVGRQELAFGQERLIGTSDWTNTARSFDGGRISMQNENFRVDLFAASVVDQRDGKFDRAAPGNNIYGLYSGFDRLIRGSKFEPYFFWRREAKLTTETGGVGDLGFATMGVRSESQLPAGFDLKAEIAAQRGSLGTDEISAWAGHWVLGCTLGHTRWTPRMIAEFDYASGDSNPADGKRNTFDQLYASGHDKQGLSDQVGWKNIEHIRAGLEVKPSAKWTLFARHNFFWLADAHDALYNSSGAPVAERDTGAAGRYVGHEMDLSGAYNLSRNTQILAGFSHLFPGTFLKATTPGEPFNLPYVSFGYRF